MPLRQGRRLDEEPVIPSSTPKCTILIEGGPGAGKSSLVGHVATRLAQGGSYLPADRSVPAHCTRRWAASPSDW